MKSLLPILLYVLGTHPTVFSQEDTTSLTVIAYNIWNGFDWGKDTIRHQLFIDWVQQQEADVMALQELCGYTQEKLQTDAAQWGHPYALILKEDGYPVGITSRQPIELVEKVQDSLWHGMLHVRTYDTDFFVVHLSPADVSIRMCEAQIISEKVRNLSHDRYILLGDFNAHSPMDADLNANRPELLGRMRDGDIHNEKYNNLRDGEYDYSVISTFLALPSIDVCHRLMSQEERYSFPSPVLVGQYYNSLATLASTHRRIDYILTSPKIALTCREATILHDTATRQLSDHYPVKATFDRGKP